MTVVEHPTPHGFTDDVLFAGPGEVRARCREIDWSATPVGAAATWPAALRATIALCLDSGFAMCVYAGPELVVVYNDAFARALGADKHPWALGRPAPEVWPEIWPEVGVEFAALMAGGPSTYFEDRPFVLDRDGRRQETFWTAMRSVVRDDDGRIIGVHTVSIETTDRVRAERALRASETRHAYLVALTDALRPLAESEAVKAAASRVLAEQLHVDRVLYSEVDGDEWLVEGGFERGIAPLVQGRYTTALYGRRLADRLRAGECVVYGDIHRDTDLTPDERERRLALQIVAAVVVPLIKRDRLVAVFLVHSATPREWTEEEIALIEETAERTWAAVEQVRAEAALRASEAKYRSLFESMGQGYAECELIRDDAGNSSDFRLVELNPAFERLTGVQVDDARGRLAHEVVPGIERSWLDAFERVVRTEKPERIEGEVGPLARWYEAHIYPRGANRFTVLYEDITAHRLAASALRESEERQAFLLKLSDALGPLTDANEVQTTASRILGEALKADRVYFGEMREDAGLAVVTSEYVRRGGPPIVGVYRYADFRETVAGMEKGTPYVMADSQRSVRLSAGTKAGYAHLGLAAFVTVPLLKAGKLVWALTVSSETPRAWTTPEVALVRETAERAWDAALRAATEAALHETQHRLEDAVATARMAYWDRDATTGVTVASRSMEAVFGLAPGERFGGDDARLALVHPDDRARYRETVEGARVRSEGWHAEFRIMRPRDGEVAWLEERATVTRDPLTGALHTTGLVWDISDRKRADAAAELERREVERDALHREMAAAEEAERRRLARELHDQLGQHLAAFSLGLADARRRLSDGRSADARLTQLEELARLMTRDARYLALELRPPELDDVGLVDALQSYVEQWSMRYGVPVEMAVTGFEADQSPSVEAASALYRIAQEGLTNIAKHAHATQVSVVLDRVDGEVRLIVEDNGRGFDVEATREQARRERRLGLAGMQERVALSRGSLTLESSPGAGTALFVRLPMDGMAAEAAPDAVGRAAPLAPP